MSETIHGLPAFGDPLSATQPDADPKAFLGRRRSTPIKLMDRNAEGPDRDTLNTILAMGLRVPDHRQLQPWRLLIIEGESRGKLSQTLRAAFAHANPEASEADLNMEADRPFRSPVCITVISSPDVSHKTPVWEQELSAGALCHNILLAANAHGWSAAWVTEWWAYDPNVANALGLGEHERIAGNIFIGSTSETLTERKRPILSEMLAYWDGAERQTLPELNQNKH